MTRWLYKRGRIYHYRFTVGGREYTGSTECEDLATAKTVLELARRDCILGEHGIRKALAFCPWLKDGSPRKAGA